MESPIQEQASLKELAARAIQFLFENSRPQFHPSLFVLAYAGAYVLLLQVIFFLISLTPWFSFVVNYKLVGIFVGCISVAELVRGHVKHWFGYLPVEWCYLAMPFGGATLTLTFWGFMHLMWGRPAWYEPLIYAAAGAAFYTIIGWLSHLEEKKKAQKAEPAQ